MAGDPEKSQDRWREDISAHRKSIDAVDEQIFALLKQRIGFVKKIGNIKHKQGDTDCMIRPGREASVVRNVFDSFRDSDFMPHAAAAIWRIIIGASTAAEAPFALSIFSPQETSPLFWMAREYFGPFLPITRQPTARRVVGDILDSKAQVGVLPLPEDSEQGQWWASLAHNDPNAPRIFACIPFISNATQQDRERWGGLAIARVKPEPTGDDTTYAVLKTDMDISQSKLNAALSKAGIETSWRGSITNQAGSRLYLLEMKGFYEHAHPAVEKFLSDAGPSVVDFVPIGSYANPILLHSTSHAKSNEPIAPAKKSAPGA